MTDNAQVVILGGGYAGITAAKALDDAADVTLVDAREAFVHNIAALRALVAPEWIDRIIFPYDRLLARGRFVQGRAVEVDVGRVELDSGEVLTPDYLVLATGSRYPFPAKSSEQSAEDARDSYRTAAAELNSAEHALLLGAGPVGLELAGEIRTSHPDTRVTIVDPADEILAGPYDQRVRDELRRQLAELGVELLLGTSLISDPSTAVTEHHAFTVTTTGGDEIAADIWYRCYGVVPQTGYLTGALAQAVNADGRIAVTSEQRVRGQDNVFAVGDIGDREAPLGGRAMRQAAVAADNVKALIAGAELVAYEPRPPAIFVPLGPEGGAGQMPGADEIAGAEQVAEIKGRHMMVDPFVQMFAGAKAQPAPR